MRPKTVFFVPSKLVEQLKQKARAIKREGIRHGEALETVAKQAGFHHWKHVTESAAVTAKAEQAYKHGLIVAYDVKDASDKWDKSDCGLHEDIQARLFCENDLRPIISEYREPDLDNKPFKEVYADELEEIIQEILDDLVFYRYDGDKLPSSISEALAVTGKCSFWPPQHIWLRGKYHDTWDIPATNDDGEIVGIRF